ncbi:hypothetical protein ACFYKX_20345 [Cytobacillus sp. FJAT-54145]|uniref:ABC transporter permease n=1 Tax=Cytobacillus spartinae TaxID=3299023 RepID=A0ABW6KJR8_9BACI
MMSLVEVNTLDIVKKQYSYKLKAYIGVFSSLFLAHVIAILFSFFGGVGMTGTGNESISLTVKLFSGDLIIGFTMIWGFIISLLITTKAYRYDDFAFVTNRLSSNLSNIGFLMTTSIVGGVTALLSSILLKVMLFFIYGTDYLMSSFQKPGDLLIGIWAAILYILLFSSIGYFVGVLVQINKLFMIFLPTLFFGSLFVGLRNLNEPSLFVKISTFFVGETSLLLFSVKIFVTVTVLFLAATSLSNRLEVRI